MARATREIAQLIAAFDQAYNRRSWHGTNLRGSIRGVNARRAARRADIRLLEDTHRTLRDTLLALDDHALRQRRQGGKYSIAELISGITAHDLYHAGQIQLLKRLT